MVTVILIILDLSAAFDTVDHESYLRDREVTVIIAKSRSITKKLTKGVRKDSVLGPMLSSIYTRELAWIFIQHDIKYKLC